ncbi:hypothetical protein [Streptomyces sp. NBC_01477]|uniref:hypothetical protein n=1 Tax=Streptomyces sp. NBC_01477 TaxID=2976015 RepID=UPI002E34838C|nr:hypothetical protein [Streptomyces sp. NBC_01477]
MTALSADMRAALDAGRTSDPRPEARKLWDTFQKIAEKSADPDGTLLALCEWLLIEVDKSRAEHGVTAFNTAATGGDSGQRADAACTYPRCQETGPHDEEVNYEDIPVGGSR